MIAGVRYFSFLAGLSSMTLCGCVQTAPVIKPLVQCDFRQAVNANSSLGSNGKTTGMNRAVKSALKPIPTNAVNVIDASIANKITVQGVQHFSSGSGTIGIAVRFANCTDFPLQIEVRTQFLNDRGSPAELVSAWQRIYLYARSHSQYQANSVSGEGVTDYLIDVREGR